MRLPLSYVLKFDIARMYPSTKLSLMFEMFFFVILYAVTDFQTYLLIRWNVSIGLARSGPRLNIKNVFPGDGFPLYIDNSYIRTRTYSNWKGPLVKYRGNSSFYRATVTRRWFPCVNGNDWLSLENRALHSNHLNYNNQTLFEHNLNSGHRGWQNISLYDWNIYFWLIRKEILT